MGSFEPNLRWTSVKGVLKTNRGSFLGLIGTLHTAFSVKGQQAKWHSFLREGQEVLRKRTDLLGLDEEEQESGKNPKTLDLKKFQDREKSKLSNIDVNGSSRPRRFEK